MAKRVLSIICIVACWACGQTGAAPGDPDAKQTDQSSQGKTERSAAEKGEAGPKREEGGRKVEPPAVVSPPVVSPPVVNPPVVNPPVMEGTVDDVQVRVDRTNPNAMVAQISVGDLVETFDVVRLSTGTELYHWVTPYLWNDIRLPDGPAEAGLVEKQKRYVARQMEQTFYASQHPFTSSRGRSDLMVVTLGDDHDLLVNKDETARFRGLDAIEKISSRSTATDRASWMKGLDKFGIGGIYERKGPAVTGVGADGTVVVTSSRLLRQVHRAGPDEMLDLIASAGWLATEDRWRPQGLAKIYATSVCERAGWTWAEIVSRMDGPQWDWLREVVGSNPGMVSSERRDAIWSACEAENPGLGSEKRRPFSAVFCVDVDDKAKPDSMAKYFVRQMCDDEQMALERRLRDLDMPRAAVAREDQ